MNYKDEKLNELFMSAKNQPTIISFETVCEQFKVSVNENKHLTKKWYSKLFNLNTIIMTLSAVIMTSTFYFLSTPNTIILDNDSDRDKTNQVKKLKKDPNVTPTLTKQLDYTYNQKDNPMFKYVQEVKKNEHFESNHIKTTVDKKVEEKKNEILTFTVSEYTSLNDLRQMSEKAKKIGLKMEYDVSTKKGIIKKLELSVELVNDNNEKWKFYKKYNGVKQNFNWSFKYILNDDGKVSEIKYYPIKYIKPNIDLIEVDYNQNQVNDSITKIQRFIIDKHTTQEHLLSIQNDAQNAGVLFVYKVKYNNKNEIKYLNLKMLIDRKGQSNLISQYYFKGSRFASFKIEVKWRKNNTGNAIDFDGNGCITLATVNSITVD